MAEQLDDLLADAKIRIKQILEAESEDFGKPQGSGGGGSFLLLGEPTAKDRQERIEIVPEIDP